MPSPPVSHTTLPMVEAFVPPTMPFPPHRAYVVTLNPGSGSRNDAVTGVVFDLIPENARQGGAADGVADMDAVAGVSLDVVRVDDTAVAANDAVVAVGVDAVGGDGRAVTGGDAVDAVVVDAVVQHLDEIADGDAVAAVVERLNAADRSGPEARAHAAVTRHAQAVEPAAALEEFDAVDEIRDEAVDYRDVRARHAAVGYGRADPAAGEFKPLEVDQDVVGLNQKTGPDRGQVGGQDIGSRLRDHDAFFYRDDGRARMRRDG